MTIVLEQRRKVYPLAWPCDDRLVAALGGKLTLVATIVDLVRFASGNQAHAKSVETQSDD